MTDTVTNDLIFEVLKKIQGDLSILKNDVTDLKTMQIRTREEINHLSADILRLERMQAETNVRLDRIERRLELTTA